MIIKSSQICHKIVKTDHKVMIVNKNSNQSQALILVLTYVLPFFHYLQELANAPFVFVLFTFC